MTLLEYFNQQFDLCAKNLMGHTKNPVYYFKVAGPGGWITIKKGS